MRRIDEIIIHCTATPRGRDFSVEQIRQWHKRRGFADVGYHYVIHLDGRVEQGRPVAQPGAHCAGHNASSIGIAYVGGLETDGQTPADTRTEQQRAAMAALVDSLQERFPEAVAYGHNEFSTKACPCFDVAKEFRRV